MKRSVRATVEIMIRNMSTAIGAAALFDDSMICDNDRLNLYTGEGKEVLYLLEDALKVER